MSLREMKFDWESGEADTAPSSPTASPLGLRAVIPSTSSSHPYPLMFDNTPVIRSGGNSPERTVIIGGEEFKLTPIKAKDICRPH